MSPLDHCAVFQTQTFDGYLAARQDYVIRVARWSVLRCARLVFNIIIPNGETQFHQAESIYAIEGLMDPALPLACGYN